MPTSGAMNYVENIKALFDSSRSKKISKGQIILYQDDLVSEVYFVRSGYVKAYLILESGETRTMFILGRNDLFPLSFSMATSWQDDKIKYFYEAMSDVEACTLSVSELKLKTERDPHATTSLLSYMAQANESVIQLLESTKTKSAADKVVATLKYIAGKLGTENSNGVFKMDIKLSHQEIADICGTTRETVSVAIKSLEAKKLVKIAGDKLALHLKD